MSQSIKSTNLIVRTIDNQIFNTTNLIIRVSNNQIFLSSNLQAVDIIQLQKSTNLTIKGFGLLIIKSSNLNVKVFKAEIQFYDGDGVSQLASIFDVFSGTSIPRGSTSPTQSFRVYNNYSGSNSVSNAHDVKIQISGDSQFITDNVGRQKVFDYTRELILGGFVDIRCVTASETGLTPPSGSTFRALFFGTPFSGSGFDTIYSSGSFNYNKYEIRFNIPFSGTSGSWNSSGTIYPNFFVDYNNEGFASDR